MKPAARRALVDTIEHLIDIAESLSRRVKNLEAAAAESKAMRFRGPWAAVNSYALGDVVLRDGQPWHCNARGSTTAQPGTSNDWSLLMKMEAPRTGSRQIGVSRAGSRGKGATHG